MERVIIDSDGHVNELDEVILEYLPQPFRGRRELLGRTLFPLTDHFHRMAESLLDGRRQQTGEYGRGRAELPGWQGLLDASRIQWAALYPSRGLAINQWHSPEWGAAVARGYNDWLYDRFTSKDSRLKGIALLHLYDIDAAVAELRRCVRELGFIGGVLMSSGLQPPLGDERYFPIYQEAERLDVGMAVHAGSSDPLGVDSARALWELRAMSHGAGQMISFLSMVNGGVFDTFPSLRVGYLEAGCGWIPYLVDRMDRVYHGRSQRLQQWLKRSPGEHLAGGRIFLHAELDEWMLRHVAQSAGRGDIFMFASDFPHEPWGEAQEQIQRFCERSDLTESLKDNVLAGAAQRFYRLDAQGRWVGEPPEGAVVASLPPQAQEWARRTTGGLHGDGKQSSLRPGTPL